METTVNEQIPMEPEVNQEQEVVSNINPSIQDVESPVTFKMPEMAPPTFGFTSKKIKPFAPKRTEAANTELAFISASSLDLPPVDIRKQLEQGDDSLLHEAQKSQGEQYYKQALEQAEKEIAKASQPQDTLEILKNLKQKLGRPPTLLEQRAAYNEYLANVQKSDTEGREVELSPVLKHTIQNNILSMELAKRQREFDVSTSYIKTWTQDFPEFFSPSATISEEYFKNYVTDIYNNLDKLAELPPERQIKFINQLVDTVIEQETFLFNNNNSLMTAGQIETLFKAVAQGAALQARGATEAEVRSQIETAFNGTIFAAEVGSIIKGIGSLGKFLMRRIHSGKVLDDVLLEQERIIDNLYGAEAARLLDPSNAQYVYIDKTTEPSLVKTVGDKRNSLKELAAQKGTTKERKALEQEKKDLGAREYELENADVNQQARVVAKEKKVKFKEARKEVQAQVNKELETVRKRKETNQELINDFDKRAKAESELSRIETFLKQGRLKETDLYEETGEVAVRQVTGGIIKPVILRENYNVFDTQFRFNPLEQTRIEVDSGKGLKGVQEATGMKAEDVAERAIMTPSPTTDIGLANAGDKSMVTDLLIVDETEEAIGLRLGRELERPLGTSLKPIYSAGAYKANDIEGSYGTYTFLLGDNGKAFKTSAEVESAVKNSGLGYDFKVVEKEDGFYAEMDVDHYLDPNKDVRGLELTGNTPSAAMSAVLNNARLVEEDLIRGLFALKNVNRSTVQKLEQMAKNAVEKLSIDETKLLMDILARGDADEMEWFTKTQLANTTDFRNVPDNVWQSYRDIRKVYDKIYQIREANYYNKQRALGNKYVTIGENYHLGKPVKLEEVDAAQVFDAVKNKVVPKEEVQGVVVRLNKAIEAEPNNFFTYAVVEPEGIKPLIRGATLSKRKGHIDRMYRDAGYTVSVNTRKIIDGKEVVAPKITHIVKTEEQANKIYKDLLEKGEDVNEPQMSRENKEMDDIFSDSENVQFGYGASHLKKRGELLRGSDGIAAADTYNVFESLFRSINNVQTALDYNVYKSIQTKFLKGFAPYLEKGAATPFDTNLDNMLKVSFKKSVNKDLKREIKNHHAYILSLLEHQRGGVFKWLDGIFRPLFNKVGLEPNAQAASIAAQKATSEMYIVWNGIYQMEQNFLPAMWTLATGGAGGFKAVRQLTAIRAAYKGNMKPLINSLDGDKELAEKLITELKNNGLIDSVGRMDDFLDLARTESAGISVKKGLGSVYKGIKKYSYDVSREKLLTLQESTIVLNNVFSYLTEFNNLMAKNGKVFDAKAAAEISFQAQKRTQTQNSVDRFAWQKQSNPVSLLTQFMQAIFKGTLDWVVEPQWEALRGVVNKAIQPVTDKRLGSLGKNKGRVADSWGKATLATLVTWGMFGPEGALGRKLGTWLEDSVREQFENPEDVPAFVNSILDGGLNTLVNEVILADLDTEFDVTATMSPAAMIDIVTEIFSEQQMTPVSAFAIGGLIESIWNSANAVWAASWSDDIDYIDAGGVVLTEMATNLKIVDSVHKAYITYWSGRNASSRTLSSELPLDAVGAVGKIFGLQEEMTSDYFFRQDFLTKAQSIFDTDFYVKKNIELGLRSYAMEVAGIKSKFAIEAKMSGVHDYQAELDAILDAGKRWVKFTKFRSAPEYEADIERAFRENSIKLNPANPEIFLKPYLEKVERQQSSIYLRSIEQRAPESYQEQFRAIREAKEIIYGEDINNG